MDIALFSTATFFGIGQALLVLFFTYVISRFGPWQAAVFFGVIELLTNVFVLVLMNVRPVAFRPVLAVFTGVGFVLVAGALFLGFVRNETFVAYDRGARTPQADSESHTRYGVEWAVFLSMTFVVSTIYGLSSKASAVTCSPFGTYDIYTGVILLMANLILIIYLVYTGKNGSLLTPFIVVSVCYVLGFSIFAYTCDNVNPLGAALIRAGYNLSYVLVLAYLARLAWATPQKTYRYFALVSMCATPLVGEVVGNAVMASGIPNETILYNVSQLSIILVALMAVGLVFGGFSFALVLSGKQDIEAPYEAFGRVLLRHTQRVSAPVTDASAEGEVVASVRDTPATQIAAFAKEYSLTQREVDVLTETLRGLTRTNVAKKLCVSPETVKGHLASIYRKAGVSSRQELIELLDSRF